jgi:hypothetical protein
MIVVLGQTPHGHSFALPERGTRLGKRVMDILVRVISHLRIFESHWFGGACLVCLALL